MLNVDEQRQILEQKRRQVASQAFEHALNAELMTAQLPLAKDLEKPALLKEIAKSKQNSEQMYASARRCDEMLKALPESAAEPTEGQE